MISFFHPNLNKGKPLVTRLSPTKIDWTYNLNTSITDTYGGQVVQLLGINYDSLIISGIFGKEGPHGLTKLNAEPNDFWDYTNTDGNSLAIGLTQLTSFFQDYFTIAAQGANNGSSTRLSGHYNQIPMIISYSGFISHDEGNLDTLASTNTHTGMWSAYPTSFPSYSRGLDQFAPQFSITFEVEESDTHADTISTLKSIEQLKDGIGYDRSLITLTPVSSASVKFDTLTRDSINDKFAQFLPALDLNNIDDAFVTSSASAVLKQDAVRNAGYQLGQVINKFGGLFGGR